MAANNNSSSNSSKRTNSCRDSSNKIDSNKAHITGSFNDGHILKNALPGFNVRYPTNRNGAIWGADFWIQGRRLDDGIDDNLWRVHDKLYDLSNFVDKHPGGKSWLETTKGMDITEAFESAHLRPSVVNLLDKYYVKDAVRRRNSPYTFKDDGFYRTLKRKAWPIISKSGSGPSSSMLLLHDSLLAAFLLLMMTAAYCHSYLIAAGAGITLAMLISTAHNFFHQADNFRMYYFDLSMLSSAEWRITHGLSHHLYPNTLYDHEVAVLEPYLCFNPHPNKSLWTKLVTPVTSHVFLFFSFLLEMMLKIVGIATGKRQFRWENLLPMVEIVVMVVTAGELKTGLWLWGLMTCCSGFFFAFPALISTHHHPEIYHAYDAFRDNPDWGLCQLDAVRDKVESSGNLILTATTFGDHTLHHMFPTVDASKLPLLYPVFLETCTQFGINFTFMKQKDLWLGMYRQLASSTPNKEQPRYDNGNQIIISKSVKEICRKWEESKTN